MQRQLIIVFGPDQGRTFTIADGQALVVGRGSNSDTRINDPRISRVHCHIQADDGKTLLIDAGSAGGTAVNGQVVQKHELTPGDVIYLGDTQIRFQLESDAERSTLVDKMFGRPKPQPTVTPLKDLVGQSLAHFRLDKIIAAGHAGMVYKSDDSQKNRACAVKVLAPEITCDESEKQRFVRAIKTMIGVKDPNIVELYAAGKNGPYCWCAMEFIDGESLAQVIDRLGIDNMLDWREVWRVAVHIGRALQAAYQHQIIHRNLTPTNILRRHRDKVCLLADLMLAKALKGTQAEQITRPGQLIGDVPYLSPERTRDDQVDCRSDIYGLGATCYALLTGRPPFETGSLPELIRKVREERPRNPKEFQLSINELFQDCVLKMIAKQPQQRQQTPADLLRDLDRVGRYNNLNADL